MGQQEGHEQGQQEGQQGASKGPQIKKLKEYKETSSLKGSPTFDEIENASMKKIREQIKVACDDLYEQGIFQKVFAWKNKMQKAGYSDRAILHTLTKCLIKRSFDGVGGAWGYCTKIISVENGNYNERDFRKVN